MLSTQYPSVIRGGIIFTGGTSGRRENASWPSLALPEQGLDEEEREVDTGGGCYSRHASGALKLHLVKTISKTITLPEWQKASRASRR